MRLIRDRPDDAAPDQDRRHAEEGSQAEHPHPPKREDSDVKALVDGGIQLSQIFDREDQTANGTCATEGFKPINTETGRECLRRKTG